MRLSLPFVSLFSATLLGVGILSSSASAQAPRTTPLPTNRPAPAPVAVDMNAILGFWEGTATMGTAVSKSSFKFSRTDGTLSAVWISDTTRNLALANISLSPDGAIVIKETADGATVTFSGKVEPAANRMGGTVVLLANNQRYAGTWQAIRKTAVVAVSDEARFKQIILDIAMGKSLPKADKDWAENYEKQKMAGKTTAKSAETDEQKKARAQPVYDQAITDYKASNFLGAIRGFSEYLKILPDDLDAWVNRGYAYNRLGQAEMALADFDHVLRIKPDHALALDEAARTRAKQPRKIETLTSISQVTDMKGTDAGYRELQSLIERYAIAGLTTDRKFEPDRLLTLDAYEMLTANGLKTLRQMASTSGITDSRFAELFDLACPKPKVAAGSLHAGEVVNALKCTFGPSTLKAISPDKPIDRGYFAMLLSRALDHGAEKVKLNSKLDGSKAGPVTAADTASAKALVDRGLELVGKKDYQGAIRLFNQALDTDPESVDAYRFRAIAALLIFEQNPAMQGQMLYTALFNFDHAINRGSTNPDDFHMRGQIHEKRGDKSKAIADYHSALRFDPNHQKARAALIKLGVTPTENDTAQAAQPVARATAKIKFFDTFDNAQKGWPIGDNAGAKTSIANSQLLLNLKFDAILISTIPAAKVPKLDPNRDFSIKVSFAFLSGKATDSFGLVWGVSDDKKRRHSCGVLQNGSCYLGKHAGGNWKDEIMTGGTKFLNKGPKAKNDLIVRKSGNQLNFTINTDTAMTVPYVAFEPNGSFGFQINGESSVAVDYIHVQQD